MRRPSRQAAERTPAMSAPVARTAGRSSARSSPASASSSPAACASATSSASASAREPRQQPAAVLDRGVDQAAAHARLAAPPRPAPTAPAAGAARARRRRRRRRRPPPRRSTASARRAGPRRRPSVLRGAPEAELDVRRTRARRAERGERGGAREAGQVADRRAQRQLRRERVAHLRDHARGRRAQRPLGGVLDVDDVDAAGDGQPRLGGVDHAHQQLHVTSTRAPWLSKRTTSARPPAPSSASSPRTTSCPCCSLPTSP